MKNVSVKASCRQNYDIELECKDWNTPRVDFSPEFWKYANSADGKPKGVYEALKAYKPRGAAVVEVHDR